MDRWVLILSFLISIVEVDYTNAEQLKDMWTILQSL